MISMAYETGTQLAKVLATGGLAAGLARNTNMTRTNNLTTRLAALAAAVVLATLSTIASVGPAVFNLPVA